MEVFGNVTIKEVVFYYFIFIGCTSWRSLAEEHCRDIPNEAREYERKCVWIMPGGNLSQSERGCEEHGGALFTFETIHEGATIVKVLKIDSNTSVFTGAVLNNLNKSAYYDWLSRPGTWSDAVQSAITDVGNASTDGDCLVLRNEKLYKEACSSEMMIAVCEREMTNECSCKNTSDKETSTVHLSLTVSHTTATNSPTKAERSFTSTTISPTNFTSTSNSPTKAEMFITSTPNSPTKAERSITSTPNSPTKAERSITSSPDVANTTSDHHSMPILPESLHDDTDNNTDTYCDPMDVLNITFSALIDKILGIGVKSNTTGSTCQRNTDVTDLTTDVTDTTVEVVEEKTTIPVTEVKFQFVSGLHNGPVMTGSKYNPPLRIDEHSTDYGILVNISRELMELQSTKHVDNKTLKAFAESVSNWTVDERLTSETQHVQLDLFEDILQVAEDLVGNISIACGDLKVSGGSIDIVSKVIQPSTNGSHTAVDLELDRESRDVDIQLSNNIFSNDSVKVRVSTVTYRGMDTIAKSVDKRISSSVISVSVKYIIGDVIERKRIQTKDAIIFVIRTFLIKDKDEESRLCTYWSFSESKWSSKGCSVIAKNSSFTTCKCNHLTNFAILVMYMEAEDISIQNQHVLFTLTTVGCSLSIACLAMTLITYVYLRMLDNEKIMIHANLSLALMLAQIVFVSSSDAHGHETACKVVALLLHFLFMASFSWMMVEGIALYMTCTRGILANINREMKVKYFLIGWGVPAIIVIVSCAAQFPSYGDGPQYSCWLSTQNGLIWAFLGPMLVIVVLNIGVMGLVVRVFLTLRTNTEKSELARLRGSLRAMVTLLPLLGLGWILSLLVPFGVVFNYFFVIVNTLQGMCVFFLHCICNEEIRKMFREKRRRWSTTRTASDFDVTYHNRRKTGSFDGIKASISTFGADNGRRHVWRENGNGGTKTSGQSFAAVE